MDIQRASALPLDVTVDVLANIANCTPIEWCFYAGGEMRIPAGAAYTTLTPYTSGTRTGTYQEHRDEDHATEAKTVAAGINQPTPSSLYGARWVKFVANAAGTFELDRKG